jgi:signal transduction histidine kinase
MTDYRISELLDMSVIQILAETHYRAAGMPLSIVDADDASVLVSVGWQEICIRFHRANQVSSKRCEGSDIISDMKFVEGQFYKYRCKNGLWHIAIPILVTGRHMATMFLSQFFYEGETPDREFFKAQAEELGFDKNDYLAALDKVPVFSNEKVDSMLAYDRALAAFIGDMAERSLKRYEAESALKRAEETHRRHLEELVQERTAELAEANAELSQYAYAVSHDLRAPLRAIHNYTDFLQEDLGATLDGEQKTYFDALGRAVKEAEALVDDILTLSRISHLSMLLETIDMGMFMQGVIAAFNTAADVEFVTAHDWPAVEAEPTLLRQIFQNLVGNAVKYNTSPHKKVELGWRSTEEGGYEFFVRDNGIGIAPRYHEQIFHVFERLHTRQEYGGTGIGLSIVKKCVARLHGRIHLESEPGKGSTFFVTIPQKQSI